MKLANANHTASLLTSLTRPSREWIYRQRACLLQAKPAGLLAAYSAPQDLDERLVQQRETTFFMRVSGNGLQNFGFQNDDLLIVDRISPAVHGSIIVAEVAGEITIKQLLHTEEGLLLRAAESDVADVMAHTLEEFSIMGVVNWKAARPC